MGIFEFLKKIPLLRTLSFQRYPDSFALTRETLHEHLLDVLQRMRKRGGSTQSSIFIAAHFPDVFFQLQTMLDTNEIEYHIITRPLDAQWFTDVHDANSGIIYLSLAELLTETTFSGNEALKAQMDLIVADRHPEPFRDDALEQFARDFPAVTKMGYFLALEDRVLSSTINDTTLTVLKQMGIEDQGLVSSGIIAKRVSKMLAREQKTRSGQAQPADSAEQWYEVNTNV